MIQIKGLSGAPGCIIGTAVIFASKAICTEMQSISDPVAEIADMESARSRYNEGLVQLAAQAHAESAEEQAAIFEAYQEILMDDVFFCSIKDTISGESVCASYAIEKKRAETEAMFLTVDDDYLKARVSDINNVCNELIAELQGVSVADPFSVVEGDQLVVFAEDLTPADTVRMDRTRLAAVVTQRGGVTSHTVILAKALGIPAIVGAGALLDKVESGDVVLIDGAAGKVVIAPDADTKAKFQTRKDASDRQKNLFDAHKTKKAVSKDGHHIRININSGDKESIQTFNVANCDGVGLFRTEFLYMENTDYPSEYVQFQTYKDMACKTAGKELIIRTLDIGGDKQLDYMNMPKESNPFLGYRAIRLCLDRPEVFRTQLRAILRASAFGNIKIMFPMIVNLEELLQAKSLVKQAMEELDAGQVPYNKEIQIGIMVETPAAVLLSDQLAKHADFFSIGSNDLIQYITATDRQNEGVQYLYNSCNISFLRAIKMACDNAHAAGIEIGICGETASEPRLIPLWLAMGIDELSVSPGLVGRTKYIVGQLSKSEMQTVLDDVVASGSINAVEKWMATVIGEIGL